MPLEIFDCPQGSPEWFHCRLGIPTASEFHSILAKGEGKMRATYLSKLAGERLTGRPMENYTNGDMERGKAQEDEARDLYAFLKGVEPQRVGFIRNGNVGCSPDSLIGDNCGLEIKSAAPHIQVQRLVKNVLPSEHKAQVQGSMWVTARDEWDFCSYCPGIKPLIVKVPRDDHFIRVLAEEIDRFAEELETLVQKLR